MKYRMTIRPLALKKIRENGKRIELRLLNEEWRKLRLHDVIEFVSEKEEDKLLCLVHGVIIFETFDEIIDSLPVRYFGYDNKEEVKIRINRLYPLQEQKNHNVIGIFIIPLQEYQLEKDRDSAYLSKEHHITGFNFVGGKDYER